ncbi:MAG: hypothetical protein ABJB85_11930 [Nitrososphaerota archaeon]
MMSSTNNKRFSLVLTTLVLIAGAVTMSLEFTASRLIIPIFGGSIYTWGSLIGVILGLTFSVLVSYSGIRCWGIFYKIIQKTLLHLAGANVYTQTNTSLKEN